MGHERVVLISGGSRGLGEAIIAAFLAEGYRAATFSRSSSESIQRRLAARELRERFSWRELDALDARGTKSYIRDIVQEWGRIDVLVNNAAVALEGMLTLTRAQDIARTLEANLEASIQLTQACARQMLTQGGGCIVSVSSIVGLRGHAGLSVYSATKAALDGFTRSLARELGPKGIRVNSVAPGYIETGMSSGLDGKQLQQIVRRTPLGRLTSAAEVASVVRFLASDEARAITGQTIVVDGGITC